MEREERVKMLVIVEDDDLSLKMTHDFFNIS